MKVDTLGIKRVQAGLSRKTLADCIGVSTQFIHQLEMGQKSPSLKTASKLASVLGCTVDDLLSKRDAG